MDTPSMTTTQRAEKGAETSRAGGSTMPDHTLQRLQRYNRSDATAWTERFRILQDLLGHVGPGTYIQPPFFCDYGDRIVVGEDVYLEADCIIRGVAGVTIEDGVYIGTGVHIYSAVHAIKERHEQPPLRLAFPVRIGRHAWIGDGVAILPGVTIAREAVIGAGSVVLEDIPAGAIAAGQPCRVLRSLRASQRKAA